MAQHPETLDLVVIGAGPGGYVAAIRAARLGMKVGLVEKDPKLGGTCLHRGCIPTKALLQTAYLYERTKNKVSAFGVQTSGVRLNWAAAHSYKERVVSKLAAGVDSLIRKNRIVRFLGRGRLEGPRTVLVDGRPPMKISTRHILLATGSVPRALPGIGFDGDGIVSSDEILRRETLPKSLLVIGAGAVGIEFASMFHRFGSEVILVELLPRIVPVEDEEIARELEKILKRRGMKVLTDSKVKEVVRAGRKYKVAVTGRSGREEFRVDAVLVAVGRAPVTEDVGLENTRVRLEKGYVQVDEMMQTDEPGVYAIGDIVPTPALAHIASAEGLVAVEHMAGKKPSPINYDHTVNCTFCDPQIASAGLTEKQARERGFGVKVGRFPFMASGKALIEGETEGLVKIVADKEFGEILGVHILHAHASDLIGEAVAVLRGELPAEDLARAIHPHPTLSEAVMEAAHGIYGLPLHL